MSSDGLSGSSGSKGSGSQSQKGCSGSSNGGHDADESTVSSVARQTPSSLESEDLGESEVVPCSESESYLKPLDASPGNVAGMDSSVSAETRTTLSTSVPAAASIEVVEESVPEDIEHTDVCVPVPTPHVDPGVQSERVHSSSSLSSRSVSSQPLDSHTANQQSASREKPFEPHPSEQGEKQLEESFVAGVDQQTSSELLPEIPGSPELLQTVCREEEEELMEDSPEIDFQAPVSMPPPGHAPQEHISSSTPDQSHPQTSITLPLLAASSSGRDMAGEPNEVSTQNSFALHWSQSQTSALTPSGILSQYKPGEPNGSQASLKLGSVSYEGLEEIEDHEREFPNLEDQDRQQQQSLEKSVSEEGISGSQKPSDRSETSLTSSSSQSVKSGSGPDSTPPEDGEGGGGDRGGGGGDRGGGGGGDMGGSGGDMGGDGGDMGGDGGDRVGGVGGSMGGSGEGEERKGDGSGDKGREQREREDGRKESDKTCQDEKSAESELNTVATATSHNHIQVPSEPSTTVIRARPVPTYESLQCEGSAEEVVVNHHEELPSVQSAPTPALIGEVGQWCGQEGGQGGVNSQTIRPPTAESQHSLELTPSGT